MTNNKILVIHPEGNINYNVNLTGIVEILCENGWNIDIYSQKRSAIDQVSPCENANLYLEDKDNIDEYLNLKIQKYLTKYHFIIGVDQDGIVEAAKISKTQNTPYGLLSYEIFFAEEIGIENKLEEIDACKDIQFAIVQDEIRGKLLCEENRIPSDKLIFIPVAGRGVHHRTPNFYLHDKLGIDKTKKIALYIGSIADWAMLDELFENTQFLPDNWVIVLHSRYNNSDYQKLLADNSKQNNKIFLHQQSELSLNDLSNILNSASIGIAFYKPNYQTKYDGKNIKYIGLSSGKISTFLQNGLSFITNINISIKPTVNQHFCFEINEFNEFFTILKNYSDIDNSTVCHSFFLEHLDLNTKINPLLTLLKNQNNSIGLDGRYLSKEINDYFKNILSQKEQAYNNHIQGSVDKIYNTTSYRIGNFIIQPFLIVKKLFTTSN